jgi:hypothetical protein
MNSLNKGFCLVVVILAISLNGYSQQQRQKRKNEIGKMEFDFIVKSGTVIMQSSDSLDLASTIIFIKVFNTLSRNNELIEEDQKYRVFYDLFYKKHLTASSKVIEAGPGRGMSYYSKKYDLSIGGSIPPNSRYFIIRE